jgi:peptide/nickel transport system substrate-binding protein
MKTPKLLAAAALALVLAAAPVAAKTFRWAADSDPGSMDPHSRNVASTLSFLGNIYEPLVRRDRDLKLEGALATAWKATSPTVWRFELRRNVKFHDGTPFTADDVVFTYERTRGPGSLLAATLGAAKAIRKIDDFTVEIETAQPTPTFPDEITSWLIMSKAWSEKNGVARATDLTKNETSHASNNANGTGPFKLKSRSPEGRVELEPHAGWWDKAEHNLTLVIFTPIANPATRSAALLSGEVDMVHTLPLNAVPRVLENKGLRVFQKAELRGMFIGFDVERAELLNSNIKGKNPFKDLRVRQAVAMALDTDAIAKNIMRGFALPNHLLVGPGVAGFDPALNRAPSRDIAAARKLMAEAGYPDGFEVGMECSNDRYVNDEQVCVAAVGMLARIGIAVKLRVMPFNQFIKHLSPPYETSLFLVGWLPITYDAHNALFNLTGSRNRELRRGVFNVGGYSNSTLDALIGQIQIEIDPAKRAALVKEALAIVRDDVAVVPTHQQVVVWAAKTNVELVQLADNYFPLRFVRVR